MALESLRDPLGRLSALPPTVNAAFDFNSDVPNDMRWSVDRQYVQNDVVVVENASDATTSAYILTGATALLGGSSPETADAWQWVSLGGYKEYPLPPAPSTFTVVARMPTVSTSAWAKAAKVGRK